MRADMDPATIDRVVVQTYAAGRNFCDMPDPATAHEARFSFQHCVAVALLQGEPELGDFDAAALAHPAIAALRTRIQVHDDADLTAAFPQKMGARLAVTLKDGTTRRMSTENAPGDPEQPMSAAAIRAKFHRNLQAAGIYSDLADNLGAAVQDLDSTLSLQSLGQHLDEVSSIISNPQTKDVSR